VADCFVYMRTFLRFRDIFSFAWLPVYSLQCDDSPGDMHRLDIVEGSAISEVRQPTEDFN
jgi:hypothetical protein